MILDIVEHILLRILGLFLFAFALFLIFQENFKIPAIDSTALLGGSLSGFLPVSLVWEVQYAACFLLPLICQKRNYIATAGAIGLLIDSTRIIAYIMGEAKLSSLLWWSLPLFIALSYMGAKIAKRVVDRIPQNKIRILLLFFFRL